MESVEILFLVNELLNQVRTREQIKKQHIALFSAAVFSFFFVKHGQNSDSASGERYPPEWSAEPLPQ